MKVYRGAARGARAYLDADRSRADDYYLTEGSGIARRYAAGAEHPVRELAPLTGNGYEAWVAGLDPETGVPRGRLRQDANAVRFVEVVVNGPKSWSLAAELHLDIAAAYDGAQDRAAEEVIGWLAKHMTTRVGPRGGQVALPVHYLEAAVVRHYSSRAGDPHRHLHLQVNARVFAAGKWRGLDTVAVREALAAVNGIGHAAMACDPQFRAALAKHGYTLTGDGEIAQLGSYVGAFSRRAAQIVRHLDRYERAWRAAHPGEEPGPALRRAWDARAWADERPDKVTPLPGAHLHDRWLKELARLGYRDRDVAVQLKGLPVARVDRDQVVDVVLAELGAARSAWNAADIRGAVEQRLATLGLVADPAARCELAEDLIARAIARCVPLLDRPGLPAHIRALTSQQVLDVETNLVSRLAARAVEPGHDLDPTTITVRGANLDAGQVAVVAALAGDRALVVVEGAAGAGKTTTLAAACDELARQDRRMIVVTPTLRGAEVVHSETGAVASSAARLAYTHGWRWDRHGVWTRLRPGDSDPATGAVHTGPPDAARLRAGDLVVVDEAGMLDQDTAAALLTLADEAAARVALVGDRHQLPAVGRGGVLDHATRWSEPVALDVVHRFVTTAEPAGRRVTVPDAEYAELSRAMRTGDDPDSVYTALQRRGQIALHEDSGTLHAAIAQAVVADRQAGRRSCVVAATREQVAEANAVIREAMVAAGHVDDAHAVTTRAGERIAAGDVVATRRNDRNLDVANRETWTVTAVSRDGGLHVRGPAGERSLPAAYVAVEVEVAYATTVHGAQGLTVDTAHLIVDEHTTAAAAYVGLTRGRQADIAYLVAADDAEARELWTVAFGRERADLGPAAARETVAREAASYAPARPLDAVLADLREAWMAGADARERLARLRPALARAEAAAAELAELDAATREAHAHLSVAQAWCDRARQRLEATEYAIRDTTERITVELRAAWDTDRPAALAAARRVEAGVGRFGRGRSDVEAAQEQLDAWTARWQPLLGHLPDSLANPSALAAGWHDGAVAEAIHTHATAAAEAAHPDQAEHRHAATAAETSYYAALDRAVVLAADRDHVEQHGNPERTAILRDLVTDADQRLTAADRDLHVLAAEPALTRHSDPTDLLTTAAGTWQHERQLRRAAEHVIPETAPRTARHDSGHNLHYGVDQHRGHGPSIGL
jgi:exodeoxyribonuclease V alpha subunit